MEPEVFICHSSVDARVASEICTRLEEGGVRCWIAPRDPVPGIPYGEQIVEAIATARIVLLVFSKNANESPPVMNEIELASNRRKIILPVRIEDVTPSPSLEFYVRAIHWFDAATRPREDAWPELVRDVQILVGETPPSAGTATAPPAAVVPKKSSNLPLQLTSFVGREQEVAELKKLLDEHRLITMVGSGGSGKTRTAIQIGGALLDNFRDGVWLVELAPVADPALVAAAIARALDVRESPDKPLLNTIVENCRWRKLLLILDNCEHLVSSVRETVGALLRACPDVIVLATSRESFNIAGERVFRLPSLAVPPAKDKLAAKPALRFGSIALFCDRAVAADGRFALANENAPYVGEICRRLDGIPLAIELAAARIKVLSPQQLAQRLNERFRVLTGGDRSALPRHQTMRAAIDWSYDLLSEQEQALFRKLSIFADGFTLEGAAAVCGDEQCDEIAVLDIVSSLVDKSLVQTDPGVEDRYGLLESTRQYGREKLTEAGELDGTSRLHFNYISRLFKRAGAEYEVSMSGTAATGLAIELEDARSALDWAERHTPSDAVDLFLATRLWVHFGLYHEGIERAQGLIGLIGEADPGRLARLWLRIAVSAGRVGHHTTAREAIEKALSYARASDEPQTIADCLMTYADIIAHFQRFDEATNALLESESIAIMTPRRRMQMLHVRALVASLRGDTQSVIQSYEQLRVLYASVGNDLGVVSAVLNLAEAEHARGASSRAVEIATSEIARAERLPNRGDWAFLMRNIAGYLNAVDDVSGARSAARKAISYYAANEPDGPFTAVALEHLALSIALEGDYMTAAALEGYVDKTLSRFGFEREYTERTTHERLVALLEEHLDKKELAELVSHGERLPSAEALSSAAAI